MKVVECDQGLVPQKGIISQVVSAINDLELNLPKFS
jgi:hypothetical protein